MTSILHGALTSNGIVNGVLWDGWKWTNGGSPVALSYYFASDGGQGWGEAGNGLPLEKEAYRNALATWASVANISFVETTNRANANLVENILSSAEMTSFTGSSGVVGLHDTPQQANAAHTYNIDGLHSASFTLNQAGGFYNYQSLGQASWTNSQLVPGSYFEMAFIHELGHSLGLKHPFNVIGAAPTLPGVPNGSSSSLGDNNLSHSFYTVMAYNTNYSFDAVGQIVFGTGNPTQVGGSSLLDYGYVDGPTALDIRAIQDLYGANTSYHSGSDVYLLPDIDQGGTNATKWLSIWDAGGNDTLEYDGSRNAILDLRSATLDDSPTGGGVLSYAAFVHGGFTIANGVVIENAIGGSGNDRITGNSADNVLRGRGGNDTVDGMGGIDTAVFSGLRSQYTLLPLDGNGVRATGPDGADMLSNVEKLTFNDQTVDWTSGFKSSTFELAAFGPGAGGWSSNDTYPRELADVNGDTRADIVAFSSAGVYESLATGNGDFMAPTFELAAFGAEAGGWSSDNIYPRVLADVSGDGKADIVAFSSAGVYESLATGNGDFMAPTFELAAFGTTAGGWSSDDTYPRRLADVNGDTRADIVAFSSAGVYESLATPGGHFAMPTFELAAFGTMAGGWSSDNTYPRELADVDGDGMADIVGFSSAGVYVSRATGNGHFGAPTFELAAFGAGAGAGGWTSDDLYPRTLADVNADGRADIVGFGSAGVYTSLATGGGHFAAPAFTDTAFGVGAGGWSSYNTYPRQLVDVNADGKADVVGFGYGGVHVSQSEFISI